MTLLTRRGLIAGAAGIAAQKKRKCPVAMQPDQQGVFFQLVVQGGGTFTYDASGNLRSANVGQTITDPIQGITCYAGFSTFNGHGAVISLFSSTLDAQFWYADTGTSAQGALTASIANTTTGTDPFGNAYLAGVVSYGSLALSQLLSGNINIGDIGAAGQPSSLFSGDTLHNGNLVISSGKNANLDTAALLHLIGSAAGTPSVIVQAAVGPPGTTALLEVQGTTAMRPAVGTALAGLDLEGKTNGAGELAFITNSPQVNGDHTLTVNQTGTGADNTVAGNFTSNSDLSSTVYISGQATQRGVLKISHNPGDADGADATASLIALDTGATPGTACQGIALISTTPTTGNLLLLRNNTLDNFVVKGSGRVAIGVAIGHTPTGMLEVQQQDTSTVGLAMTAIAAGTDMVNLKDSGGAQRFQIGNAGNMTVRATAFMTSPVVFGATSSGVGGGGGGTLQVVHNTDPTSNPPAGSILLYCDASGNLLARTQAGNVRTVAAV